MSDDTKKDAVQPNDFQRRNGGGVKRGYDLVTREQVVRYVGNMIRIGVAEEVARYHAELEAARTADRWYWRLYRRVTGLTGPRR